MQQMGNEIHRRRMHFKKNDLVWHKEYMWPEYITHQYQIGLRTGSKRGFNLQYDE
jgi:hypothetical protein